MASSSGIIIAILIDTKGIDLSLVQMHQRYIQKASRLKCIEGFAMRMFDIWHSSDERSLVQNIRKLKDRAT